jgi:hypothetical protein
MLVRTTAIVAFLLGPSLALADPLPYAIGVRAGGYGFRPEGDPGSDGWNQCRMNGIGVFGDRGIGGPLFVEAGLDAYFSLPYAEGDLPIDRMSTLVSAAAGVRTQLASRVRGFVQLGVGAELTRVSVPYGDARIRDNKLLPDGFFGVGVDVRLGRSTMLGAAARAHVMGNFDYDPARLEMQNPWIAAPPAGAVFDASPDLAAQAQFYLRREL